MQVNITWQIFFFENHAQNETGRLVPDLFLYFKMALYMVKASKQDELPKSRNVIIIYLGFQVLKLLIKPVTRK